MYRNIFPDDEGRPSPEDKDSTSSTLSLSLPPALQSFPLHLVEIFMATLKEYLPNITDPAVRESLLMQVLYAANSLGRLGADFSLMIAMLYEDEDDEEEDVHVSPVTEEEEKNEGESSKIPQNGETEDDSQHDQESNEAQKQTEKEESSPPPQPLPQQQQEQQMPEPEWISVIKKHRVQAARLEALAAGQARVVQRRESSDVAVR